MFSSGRPEVPNVGPLHEYYALGRAEQFLQPQLPLGIFHPNPWCMISIPTGLGPTTPQRQKHIIQRNHGEAVPALVPYGFPHLLLISFCNSIISQNVYRKETF